MRIVNIPTSSIQNVGSSSWYLGMEDLSKFWKDDFWFYFLDHTKQEEIAKRHLDRNISNTKVLWYDGYKVDFYNGILSFDFRELTRQFSYLLWNYPVDAFFGHNPYLAYLIKKYTIDLRRFKFEPLVFIQEQKVLEKREDSMNEEEYLFYNMWYVMGYPIFLGEHEKRVASKILSTMFNGTAMELFHSKAVSLPLGMDCDYIDSLTRDIEKNEKPTMFFWGRLNNGKRIAEIFDEYYYVYASGQYECACEITTGSMIWNQKEIQSQFKKWADFMTIHQWMDREAYLKIAARCHVALIKSKTEACPIWYREQAYAWVILILPDYDRVRAWIPEHYPFIYKNADEARYMLRYIIENYEEATEKVKRFKPFLKSKFDNPIVYQQYLDHFQKCISKNIETCKRAGKWNLDLIDDAFLLLKDREKVSYNDLVAVMKKASKTFQEATNIRSKAMNQYEIYANALNMWAKDLCDWPYPNFINPKFVK